MKCATSNTGELGEIRPSYWNEGTGVKILQGMSMSDLKNKIEVKFGAEIFLWKSETESYNSDNKNFCDDYIKAEWTYFSITSMSDIRFIRSSMSTDDGVIINRDTTPGRKPPSKMKNGQCKCLFKNWDDTTCEENKEYIKYYPLVDASHINGIQEAPLIQNEWKMLCKPNSCVGVCAYDDSNSISNGQTNASSLENCKDICVSELSCNFISYFYDTDGSNNCIWTSECIISEATNDLFRIYELQRPPNDNYVYNHSREATRVYNEDSDIPSIPFVLETRVETVVADAASCRRECVNLGEAGFYFTFHNANKICECWPKFGSRVIKQDGYTTASAFGGLPNAVAVTEQETEGAVTEHETKGAACPSGTRALTKAECAAEFPTLSYNVGNGDNAVTGVHANFWLHGCSSTKAGTAGVPIWNEGNVNNVGKGGWRYCITITPHVSGIFASSIQHAITKKIEYIAFSCETADDCFSQNSKVIFGKNITTDISYTQCNKYPADMPPLLESVTKKQWGNSNATNSRPRLWSVYKVKLLSKKYPPFTTYTKRFPGSSALKFNIQTDVSNLYRSPLVDGGLHAGFHEVDDSGKYDTSLMSRSDCMSMCLDISKPNSIKSKCDTVFMEKSGWNQRDNLSKWVGTMTYLGCMKQSGNYFTVSNTYSLKRIIREKAINYSYVGFRCNDESCDDQSIVVFPLDDTPKIDECTGELIPCKYTATENGYCTPNDVNSEVACVNSCDNDSYTDSKECKEGGGIWTTRFWTTYGYCTPNDVNTEVECVDSCDNASYTEESQCTANGSNWTTRKWTTDTNSFIDSLYCGTRLSSNDQGAADVSTFVVYEMPVRCSLREKGYLPDSFTESSNHNADTYTRTQLQCVCPKGYSGVFCETLDGDVCESDYDCSSHGTCGNPVPSDSTFEFWKEDYSCVADNEENHNSKTLNECIELCDDFFYMNYSSSETHCSCNTTCDQLIDKLPEDGFSIYRKRNVHAKCRCEKGFDPVTNCKACLNGFVGTSCLDIQELLDPLEHDTYRQLEGCKAVESEIDSCKNLNGDRTAVSEYSCAECIANYGFVDSVTGFWSNKTGPETECRKKDMCKFRTDMKLGYWGSEYCSLSEDGGDGCVCGTMSKCDASGGEACNSAGTYCQPGFELKEDCAYTSSDACITKLDTRFRYVQKICVDVNECADEPCGIGGVCSQTSDGYTLAKNKSHCSCLAGYIGGGIDQQGKAIPCVKENKCANNPCNKDEWRGCNPDDDGDDNPSEKWFKETITKDAEVEVKKGFFLAPTEKNLADDIAEIRKYCEVKLDNCISNSDCDDILKKALAERIELPSDNTLFDDLVDCCAVRNKWHKGSVTKINSDGSMDIAYDDVDPSTPDYSIYQYFFNSDESSVSPDLVQFQESEKNKCRHKYTCEETFTGPGYYCRCHGGHGRENANIDECLLCSPGFFSKDIASHHLYDFGGTMRFDNCGKEGSEGPDSDRCKNSYNPSYDDDHWIRKNDFFNVEGGIQIWTAPATATYTIEAAGASDAWRENTNNKAARKKGKGAIIRANFNLTKGEKIEILVGQSGNIGGNDGKGYGAGGSGGTFVMRHSPHIPHKYRIEYVAETTSNEIPLDNEQYVKCPSTISSKGYHMKCERIIDTETGTVEFDNDVEFTIKKVENSTIYIERMDAHGDWNGFCYFSCKRKMLPSIENIIMIAGGAGGSHADPSDVNNGFEGGNGRAPISNAANGGAERYLYKTVTKVDLKNGNGGKGYINGLVVFMCPNGGCMCETAPKAFVTVKYGCDFQTDLASTHPHVECPRRCESEGHCCLRNSAISGFVSCSEACEYRENLEREYPKIYTNETVCKEFCNNALLNPDTTVPNEDAFCTSFYQDKTDCTINTIEDCYRGCVLGANIGTSTCRIGYRGECTRDGNTFDISEEVDHQVIQDIKVIEGGKCVREPIAIPIKPTGVVVKYVYYSPIQVRKQNAKIINVIENSGSVKYHVKYTDGSDELIDSVNITLSPDNEVVVTGTSADLIFTAGDVVYVFRYEIKSYVPVGVLKIVSGESLIFDQSKPVETAEGLIYVADITSLIVGEELFGGSVDSSNTDLEVFVENLNQSYEGDCGGSGGGGFIENGTGNKTECNAAFSDNPATDNCPMSFINGGRGAMKDDKVFRSGGFGGGGSGGTNCGGGGGGMIGGDYGISGEVNGDPDSFTAQRGGQGGSSFIGQFGLVEKSYVFSGEGNTLPNGYVEISFLDASDAFGECRQCPANHFTSDWGSAMCTKHLKTKEECDTFSQIFIPGTASKDSACESCSAGQKWVPGTVSTCAICPLGHYSENYPKETCTKCPPGKYIDLIEPLDHTNHAYADSCKTCNPGWITETYPTNPDTEDPGGATSCTACEVGFYSPGASQTCKQCAAGSYADEVGKSQCSLCVLREYQELTGKTECTPCEAGFETNTHDLPGAISCTGCEIGMYSESSDIPCEICEAGQYVEETQSSSCNACGKGKYLENKTIDGVNDVSVHVSSIYCINCDKGRYSGIEGAPRQDDCIKCHAGTYLDTDGSTSENDCKLCTAGKYAPGIGENNAPPGYTSVENCILCPVGTYNDILEISQDNPSTVDIMHLECPQGYRRIQLENSTYDCRLCSLGKFAVASPYEPETDRKKKCLFGSKWYWYDLTETDEKCGKQGHKAQLRASLIENQVVIIYIEKPGEGYSNGSLDFQADSCDTIPEATYNVSVPDGKVENITIINSGNCTETPTVTVPDTNQQDFPCPSDNSMLKRCPIESPENCYPTRKNFEKLSVCKVCPAGRYGKVSNPGECYTCPPGTYNDSPRNWGEADGTTELGFRATKFDDDGVEVISCINCPVGSYLTDSTTAVMHDELADCIVCPGGTYMLSDYKWDDTDNRSENVKQLGLEIKFGGANSPTICKSCPAGTYLQSNGNASDHSSQPNSENPGEITACITCPGGRWSSAEGVDSQDKCVQCDPGFYLDDTITGFSKENCNEYDDCQKCGFGKYSTHGQTVCTPCPGGRYMEEDENRRLEENCIQCPKGKWQSGLASKSCIACDKGRYLPYIGRDENACLPCDTGRYSDEFATVARGTNVYPSDNVQKHCKVCSVGQYIGGEGKQFCIPVPLPRKSWNMIPTDGNPGEYEILFEVEHLLPVNDQDPENLSEDWYNLPTIVFTLKNCSDLTYENKNDDDSLGLGESTKKLKYLTRNNEYSEDFTKITKLVVTPAETFHYNTYNVCFSNDYFEDGDKKIEIFHEVAKPRSEADTWTTRECKTKETPTGLSDCYNCIGLNEIPENQNDWTIVFFENKCEYLRKSHFTKRNAMPEQIVAIGDTLVVKAPEVSGLDLSLNRVLTYHFSYTFEGATDFNGDNGWKEACNNALGKCMIGETEITDLNQCVLLPNPVIHADKKDEESCGAPDFYFYQQGGGEEACLKAGAIWGSVVINSEATCTIGTEEIGDTCVELRPPEISNKEEDKCTDDDDSDYYWHSKGSGEEGCLNASGTWEGDECIHSTSGIQIIRNMEDKTGIEVRVKPINDYKIDDGDDSQAYYSGALKVTMNLQPPRAVALFYGVYEDTDGDSQGEGGGGEGDGGGGDGGGGEGEEKAVSLTRRDDKTYIRIRFQCPDDGGRGITKFKLAVGSEPEEEILEAYEVIDGVVSSTLTSIVGCKRDEIFESSQKEIKTAGRFQIKIRATNGLIGDKTNDLDGEYSKGETIVVCGSGTFVQNNICVSCEQGYFNKDKINAEYCLKCPLGFKCPDTPDGRINPKRCEAPGDYCAPGNSVASVCPEGFYCRGGRYMYPCDAPYDKACILPGACLLMGRIQVPLSEDEEICIDQGDMLFTTVANGTCKIAIRGGMTETSCSMLAKNHPNATVEWIPPVNISVLSVCVSRDKGTILHGISESKCPEGQYYANLGRNPDDPINCPFDVVENPDENSPFDETDTTTAFYCGKRSSSPRVCEKGFYCPHSASKLSCDTDGDYCEEGSRAPGDCPPGYYCWEASMKDQCVWNKQIASMGGIKASQQKNRLFDDQTGWYCAGRNKTPAECPTGYYCKRGKFKYRCDGPFEGCFVNGKFFSLFKTKESCDKTITDRGLEFTYGTRWYYDPNGIQEHINDSTAPYCPTGSSTWGICPAGYACNSSTERMLCSDIGAYCPKGSKIQTSCPAGMYCRSPSEMNSCVWDNTYCSSSAVNKMTCEQNLKSVSYSWLCEEGSTIPKPCPAGSTCIGAMFERDCPLGFYCARGLPPKECIYNESDDDILLKGPDEDRVGLNAWFCKEGSSAPQQCEIGHYCQEGKLQIACSNDTEKALYCPANSQKSEYCPAEHYCPTPSEKKPCISVANRAKYCPSGSREESLCSEGSYCLTSGSSNSCIWDDANPDKNLENPDLEIAPQELKWYCPEGTESPIKCPAGFQCILAKIKKTCPSGYYCEENIAPKSCRYDPDDKDPNLEWKNNDDSSQSKILPAFYCRVDQSVIEKNHPGLSEPKLCPPGFYCNDNIKYPCDYPYHHACMIGEINISMLNACIIEITEQVEDADGTTSAVKRLSILTDSNDKATCEARKGKWHEKASDEEGCKAIAFSESSSNAVNAIWEEMIHPNSPIGKCTREVSSGTLVDVTDTYPSKTACESANDAENEEENEEENEGDDIQRFVWSIKRKSDGSEIAFFCPSGTKLPLPCPAGMYCPHSTIKEQCQPGEYCPEGSILNEPCPRGYYCLDSVSKRSCEWDSDIIDESEINIQKQNLCHYSSSSGEGNGNQNACKDDASFCPGGNSTPDECPAGYYCKDGAEKISCDPEFCLSASKLEIISSRTTEMQCVWGVGKCMIGDEDITDLNTCVTFSDHVSSTNSLNKKLCVGENNYWHSKGSGKEGCVGARGTWVNNTYRSMDNFGHTILNMSTCKSETINGTVQFCQSECDKDIKCVGFDRQLKFSAEGEHPCNLRTQMSESSCPLKERVGVVSYSRIRDGPSGVWYPAANTGVEMDAYYCKKGSKSMSLCPAGYFCRSSHERRQCDSGIGLYCPAGSRRALNCEAGYYCELASLKKSCVWNPDIEDNLIDSPSESWYCPSNSSYPTSCEEGFYCKDAKVKLPCPIGFYCARNKHKATCKYNSDDIDMNLVHCEGNSACTSITSDVECKKNQSCTWKEHYCGEGTITPSICPGGFYCKEGNVKLSCDFPYIHGACRGAIASNWSTCVAFGGVWEYEMDSDPNTRLGRCKLANGTDVTNVRGTPMLCEDPKNPAGVGTWTAEPKAPYCPEGSLVPKICPKGSYCPKSSVLRSCGGDGHANYCEEGSYSPKICPAGYYCSNASEKKICIWDSQVDQENIAEDKQYYCPEGTVFPKTCPESHVCPGAHSKVLCPSGFYCVDGAFPKSCVFKVDPVTGQMDSNLLENSNAIAWFCPPATGDISLYEEFEYCIIDGEDIANIDVCVASDAQSLMKEKTDQYSCTSAGGNWHVKDTGTCINRQGVIRDVTDKALCKEIGAKWNPKFRGDYECAWHHGQYRTKEKMRVNRCPEGYYCKEGKYKYSCDFPYDNHFYGVCQQSDGTILSSDVDRRACLEIEDAEYIMIGERKRNIFLSENLQPKLGRCLVEGVDLTIDRPTPESCESSPDGEIGIWSVDAFARYCPTGSGAPDAGNRCKNSREVRSCENNGFYCPAGSFEQVKCPAGFFCESSNVKESCIYNEEANKKTKTKLENETVSWFCPEKTITPIKCPAGYFCENAAKTEVCPAGFYCEEGEFKKPCVLDPNASADQVKDKNLVLEDHPIQPPSWYCPEGTSMPVLCPEGFYCEQGKFKYSCDFPFHGCMIGSNIGPAIHVGIDVCVDANDHMTILTRESFCAVEDERHGNYTFIHRSRDETTCSIGGTWKNEKCYDSAMREIHGREIKDCSISGIWNVRGISSPRNVIDCELLLWTEVDLPIGKYKHAGIWYQARTTQSQCENGIESNDDAGSDDAGSDDASNDDANNDDENNSKVVVKTNKIVGTWSPHMRSPSNRIIATGETYHGEAYRCIPGTGKPVLCPEGSYCPNSKTVMECTEPGAYCGKRTDFEDSTAGWRNPSICPAGYYCMTSASKVKCKGIEFCAAGQFQALECPVWNSVKLVTGEQIGGDRSRCECPASYYAHLGGSIEYWQGSWSKDCTAAALAQKNDPGGSKASAYECPSTTKFQALYTDEYFNAKYFEYADDCDGNRPDGATHGLRIDQEKYNCRESNNTVTALTLPIEALVGKDTWAQKCQPCPPGARCDKFGLALQTNAVNRRIHIVPCNGNPYINGSCSETNSVNERVVGYWQDPELLVQHPDWFCPKEITDDCNDDPCSSCKCASDPLSQKAYRDCTLRECLTPDNCEAGPIRANSTSNWQNCREGHMGILCALCMQGWALQSDGKHCTKCQNENQESTGNTKGMIILCILLGFFSYFVSICVMVSKADKGYYADGYLEKLEATRNKIRKAALRSVSIKSISSMTKGINTNDIETPNIIWTSQTMHTESYQAKLEEMRMKRKAAQLAKESRLRHTLARKSMGSRKDRLTLIRALHEEQKKSVLTKEEILKRKRLHSVDDKHGLLGQYWAELGATVKLVLSYTQVLSQMQYASGEEYPENYTAFIESFHVINFDIMRFAAYVSPCDFSSDFATKFYAYMMVMPLIFFVILLALKTAHGLKNLSGNTVKFTKASATMNAKRLLILVMFCIYPSFSVRCFRVFNCFEVNGSNYLVADLAVSCDDSQYRILSIVAISAIIVYVIGVPVIGFCILWPNRVWLIAEEAMGNEMHEVLLYNKDLRILHYRITKTYGSIFISYRHEVWWYEFVELIRKAMLTGMLAALPGGITRNAVAVVISVMFFVLCALVDPFRHLVDFHLQLILLFAIFCSFYSNLLISANAFRRKNEQTQLGLFLIGGNCFLLIWCGLVLSKRLPWIRVVLIRAQEMLQSKTKKKKEEDAGKKRNRFSKMISKASTVSEAAMAEISAGAIKRKETLAKRKALRKVVPVVDDPGVNDTTKKRSKRSSSSGKGDRRRKYRRRKSRSSSNKAGEDISKPTDQAGGDISSRKSRRSRRRKHRSSSNKAEGSTNLENASKSTDQAGGSISRRKSGISSRSGRKFRRRKSRSSTNNAGDSTKSKSRRRRSRQRKNRGSNLDTSESNAKDKGIIEETKKSIDAGPPPDEILDDNVVNDLKLEKITEDTKEKVDKTVWSGMDEKAKEEYYSSSEPDTTGLQDHMFF